jgi:ubiquinone/menaquinone biosynthesis C-methylase UbiE
MPTHALAEGSRLNAPKIESEWLRSLARGEQPDPQSLKTHLMTVHRHFTGFTENCAGRCLDEAGRTTYQWLAEQGAVPGSDCPTILDLACGSGPLLAECAASYPGADLIGVDMSPDELALAKARLSGSVVTLHQAMAQDLSMIDTASVDVVLCHWALTLMDPVEPVMAEIGRVLRDDGVFAAIVDGPGSIAPGYDAIDRIIFDAVAQTVHLETAVVRLSGPPCDVAREAAGFYYASFALPPYDHAEMLEHVEAQLRAMGNSGDVTFSMPVTRLVVRL